jgi:hypothetical protein
MLVEKFKADLRAICTLIEDVTIENEVYFDTILDAGDVDFQTLKDRVQAAQKDQERRKKVHQMYAEMWSALEVSGVAALFEGLLEDLPPNDTPN